MPKASATSPPLMASATDEPIGTAPVLGSRILVPDLPSTPADTGSARATPGPHNPPLLDQTTGVADVRLSLLILLVLLGLATFLAVDLFRSAGSRRRSQ